MKDTIVSIFSVTPFNNSLLQFTYSRLNYECTQFIGPVSHAESFGNSKTKCLRKRVITQWWREGKFLGGRNPNFVPTFRFTRKICSNFSLDWQDLSQLSVECPNNIDVFPAIVLNFIGFSLVLGWPGPPQAPHRKSPLIEQMVADSIGNDVKMSSNTNKSTCMSNMPRCTKDVRKEGAQGCTRCTRRCTKDVRS